MTLARRLLLFILILGGGIALLPVRSVHAQLIVLNRVVRVLRTDPVKGIIEVAPVGEAGQDADVIVDTDTRMFMFDKQVPGFSWHLLRKGMKIRVQGGATWDVRVRAKKIFILGGEGNTP